MQERAGSAGFMRELLVAEEKVGELKKEAVHVATPLEVCEQRDRKGLYAKARAGLIKGVQRHSP